MSKIIIPQFIRYNTPTPEKCEFQEYSHDEKKMVNCGKTAIGNRKKIQLCYEHFQYAMSIEGIPEKSVETKQYQPPKGKKK